MQSKTSQLLSSINRSRSHYGHDQEQNTIENPMHTATSDSSTQTLHDTLTKDSSNPMRESSTGDRQYAEPSRLSDSLFHESEEADNPLYATNKSVVQKSKCKRMSASEVNESVEARNPLYGKTRPSI